MLADGRVAGLFHGLDFAACRRPGRQLRLADPGDLAAVLGGHDGGDGGRGRPVPAAKRPLGEQRHECLPVADVSVDALVAGGLARVLGITAGSGFVAWRRSGYRPSMGLLELLRLAWSPSSAVLLNQPEWIEEFRPEEKPAIAVLWDASTSMDTRDVVARRRQAVGPASHAARPSPPLTDRRRGEAARADERRGPAVLAARSRDTAPICTSRWPAPSEKITEPARRSCWPPTATGTRARRRCRPPPGCGSRGCRSSPSPVGSRTRLPDVELLSLDAADLRRRRQGGAHSVHDR